MKLLKIESEGHQIDEVVMFVPDEFDKALVLQEVRNEAGFTQANIAEIIQLPPDTNEPAFRKYRCYVG